MSDLGNWLSNGVVYLLAFVVGLGLLVTFHELGHYLVARLCDVKVLRFCIGFGRPVWSHRSGPDATEWALAAIPLGGYVKMLDEREAPVAEHELSRSFMRKPAWQRILIVAAGPLANLLLAIIFYWLVFLQGTQELRPVFAAPVVNTPAAAAGFQNGDLIRSVNGKPVETMADFRMALLDNLFASDSLRLEVKQGNAIMERQLKMPGSTDGKLDEDVLGALGFAYFSPKIAPVLSDVVAKTPAAIAGLKSGDRILAANGKPIAAWDEFVAIIRSSPGKVLQVSYRRGDKEAMVSMVPSASMDGEKTIGRIGVGVQRDPALDQLLLITIDYTPMQAFWQAGKQVWQGAKLSLVMMGKMITGHVSVRNLSGPVTIADYAGQSAKLGIVPYLKFLALISLSLAVLNLLPIPILDGGHLMYYLAEILKGSPVSERAQIIGQRIGIGFVGGLMLIALFNDFTRLLLG